MPVPSSKPVDTATRERRVLDAIDDGATVALLERLIEARSENPPGNEAGVTTVVGVALAAAGVPVRLEEVAPGRPNLHAVVGAGHRPCLVLNAHTDTMPAGPGWSGDPFVARRDGNLLYGRGAADTKGGLAAMVAAVVALRRSGVELAGRLELQAVVDEEAGGSGTARALESTRDVDWAIVAEPTDLRVARASNGQVDVRVVFHGRAAHGSTPGDGRSAIGDAAAFARLVEEANAAFAAGAGHPLTGVPSVQVGTIAGGVQTSIVPPSCELTVDRRVVPGQDVEAALADLDELLGRLEAERPGLAADRAVFLAIPPVEVAPDVPVCRVLERAVADVAGLAATATGLRATSDAAAFLAAGIPAVVFGPGSLGQAHRADERVPLDQVFAASRILALAIVRLLA